MKILWIIIQALIGFHLVFPLFLYVFYALRKTLQGTRSFTAAAQPADYAVIITAYEQTHQLPAAIRSMLEQRYQNFIIYVVLDNCAPDSFSFVHEQVVLLWPESVLAGNVRSHFYAINRFVRAHNRITIIDSDNIAAPGYLDELNVFFDRGYEAVQGVREPKNLNTTLACLDAARDLYYHFYDGKLLYGAGSSATLAGSGMAFTTRLYRDCLENFDMQGAGFDKVLQNKIVQKDKRIAFAQQAIVFDEKTTQASQLVNQRSRWINTWFSFFYFGFGLAGRGLMRFSINQFLFGLVLLRPPLFIFLLLSLCCMTANIFISGTAVLLWLAGFICFIAGFFLALLQGRTDPRIFRALAHVPKFIWLQVRALLFAAKANQRSVATKHD
ncbi:glycosyltransferase [Pedobacter sp. SYP-B3415]|uniref:glycosyltransferase n=1 Tax=Pedobacter sp. SYP-B3415 TaxID=2496641 RepID=UPI00101B8505|nr:glycosyltransferase [Pedobacter sp. SYP-B3415]